MKKIAETEIPQLPVPAPPVGAPGGPNGGGTVASMQQFEDGGVHAFLKKWPSNSLECGGGCPAGHFLRDEDTGANVRDLRASWVEAVERVTVELRYGLSVRKCAALHECARI